MKNRVVSILAISLLAIITIASIGLYVSRPQTIASASNNKVPSSQSLSVEPTQVLVSQANKPKSPSVTNNDITVEINSAKIIDTGLEISICYTTLDSGEWYPMPSPLFYGDYKIPPAEASFLDNEILADGKKTGMRCALIDYRVDDLTTITTPISFSILYFYAPPREMYSPCQELEHRLNTNPKAQAHGLKAKCNENADGSFNATLESNNDSITHDEAQKELDDISSAEVHGNWMLTINDITK